jgi:hypothetical protein
MFHGFLLEIVDGLKKDDPSVNVTKDRPGHVANAVPKVSASGVALHSVGLPIGSFTHPEVDNQEFRNSHRSEWVDETAQIGEGGTNEEVGQPGQGVRVTHVFR